MLGTWTLWDMEALSTPCSGSWDALESEHPNPSDTQWLGGAGLLPSGPGTAEPNAVFQLRLLL